MMFYMLVLGLAVFDVIFLRIELVIALSYKKVTANIIECEHKDARLIWEYELQDGEYVKAKTWFTGVNKTARRIAYWKDTDGLTIESEYRDRVTMIGKDSILLRDVTTRDDGLYTLIPSFPLSSDPDPKLTLNLTVYIPPLKEAGCCRPDINASDLELHAFLHSVQACGKPSPMLNWTIARNKMIMKDRLILGLDDKGGTYKVCVNGPAVDIYFDGDKDVLCKSYTVPIERPPERLHVPASLTTGELAGLSVGISVGVLVLVLVVVKLILVNRRAKRGTARLKEAEPFIRLGENLCSVKSLTNNLINIYKGKPQFQKADSSLKLKVKLHLGSSEDIHIDFRSYRNVLCENGKPLQRVLMIGEVGCGKKTWCNGITQDWCDAQSENMSDTEHDNIKFLRNFKLLFNVSLKRIKKFSNLNQLLTPLRIPVLHNLNIDISKHLQEHKAIFIIRGVEEYPGSPEEIKQIFSDEHLQQSLIIVTSRPTVWDNKYKEIISFDRIISVQGLDEKEMRKRAQRILEGHGFPQKAIDDFFFLIKERELEELSVEPIFFPSLVTMWQINCSLPRNNADFLLNLIENKIKKKGRFLKPKSSKYRSDLGNSLVFRHKEFTLHYGKIIQGIGEIAFKMLCSNNQSFDEQHFDIVLNSQNCDGEESLKFMKDFCVCIGIVSKEEDGDFSFQHIMLQTILAAIYVSTLGKEQGSDGAEKLNYLNNFSDFLNFINPK